MVFSVNFKHIFFILILQFSFGCQSKKEMNDRSTFDTSKTNYSYSIEGVSEFKKGDIIVRPNGNFMPGSANVPHGYNFGHAAIVTKGFQHHDTDTLLANITIIESMAADVSKPFQVREVPGLLAHHHAAIRSISFDNRYSGNRYRLRLDIDESQIDSIISFARQQKGDYSCWNAMKRFPVHFDQSDTSKTSWADNHDWYCSLLVWQSVFYITGIDIDVNKGYQVYPNDLITHPIFNNRENHVGRAKF